MIWRLIQDDGVSASFGLAADETVTHHAGRGASPATLRLYTYQSYCALVGRFQNLENEIRVEACLQNDVQFNRRPTGGGAIIMGHDQLGVALMLPGLKENSYGGTRELMGRFSQGLVHALNSFGIDATFKRKNDLEVNGKKIAGLGIYRDPDGGLLFHASLLVDLDVPLMLKILQTPFEKISDKEIRTVANRISTVRKETGQAISLDVVRDRVGKGFAATFDVALENGDFSDDEMSAIAELEKDKYNDQQWIHQSSEVADHMGAVKRKTSDGLLDIRITMAGRLLKAVYIGGDFFASENAVADLEASLRWHSSEAEKVEQTIEKIYHQREAELEMLPQTELVQTIVKAAEKAMNENGKTPYGCFVTPGGEHA